MYVHVCFKLDCERAYYVSVRVRVCACYGEGEGCVYVSETDMWVHRHCLYEYMYMNECNGRGEHLLLGAHHPCVASTFFKTTIFFSCIVCTNSLFLSFLKFQLN